MTIQALFVLKTCIFGYIMLFLEGLYFASPEGKYTASVSSTCMDYVCMTASVQCMGFVPSPWMGNISLLEPFRPT